MILLDTCTLLWLTGQQEKLSKLAQSRLQDETDGIFVSAITAFEIGLLVQRGRIRFDGSPPAWFHTALELYGLRELPVDAGIAFLAAELPRIHNDPADRLLIASAMVHHMDLLTPDPFIRQYPDAPVVW